MPAHEEITERLDLILATLRLAFASELGAARDAYRSDRVNAAILDATEAWTASTDIQRQAAKTADAGTSTVRARLPELVQAGLLQARGTERRMEYRRSGLI